MALKPGYKQTEIGVIPEDWQEVELRNLVSMMTNGFVGVATKHYVNNQNGILYIRRMLGGQRPSQRAKL